MNWQVPLFDQDFGEAEFEAVQKPLRDKWITMGEVTQKFEVEFARRSGARHALAVNNCTAGLHLAVAALGIGPGDEVICPTLTFVATANAIHYVGATPIFCDVAGVDNLNCAPSDIAQLITKSTKAIMVLHYAGFPADMKGIVSLARKHGLAIIEDCAHALFSTLQGRACGTWGDIAAFSFFGNKNITCGEGGMVTTNDDELAARVRNMRSHGMTTLTLDRYKGRAFTYDVVAHGYNYRMDEIRSGLALVQLGRLEGFLEQRKRVYERYCEGFEGSEVTVPDFSWKSISSPGDAVGYHIMPVILPETSDRDEVAAHLKEHAIQSSMHYRPVHTFAVFAAAARGLGRTERIAQRQLTLPMYPTLRDEQVDTVCRAVLGALARQ
jgi:dTDP-4-amino-4,6-dideoxygalactose transaminase